MGYLAYLAKRVGSIVPTLVGLSILIFFLVRVLPGDPAAVALGEFATPETIEIIRSELWLDRPLHIQYFKFISDIFNLRFGLSVRTWHDVSLDVFGLIPSTLELAFFAMGIAIVLGVSIGIVSAQKKNRIFDSLVRTIAVFGAATPRFLAAILLQLVFSYLLHLFPLYGRISPSINVPPRVTGSYLLDSLFALRFDAFVDSLTHIILPAFALSLSVVAQLSRLVRARLLDEDKKDYVLTLRANAVPRNLVVNKYMLKSTFSAALTIIGHNFGQLLGGSFLVETVFAWPGLGRYGVQSLLASDFNAVVAVVLIVGVTYALVYVVVDVLYGYLDPRVAIGYAGRGK
jgi:peptide/nickel transport system permease protein